MLAFFTFCALAFSLVKGWYLPVVILVPVIVFQFFDYFNYHKKAQLEIEQFVESVHYRDFSRHFNVKQAPPELQPFRTGFNEINSTFKVISKEKETQYLYLKTILEIVDTGILSYEVSSGDILWMNESLKAMLQIPYLKTIHSLQKRNNELYDQVVDLSPGGSLISTLQKDKSSLKVLLSATTFQTDEKKYKLIAFQNINEALDETESRAWQKLLSVMTHEIMNSVAPISSLADTLKNRIQESAGQERPPQEALNDIEMGINTIKKRSESLLRFTETYRNLSKITKANVSRVMVIELFEHVQQLLQPSIEKKKISLEIILKDPFLSVEADPDLLEQVLINLLLNAMDAVKDHEDPKITLSGDVSAGKVIIKIKDNGCGIPADVMEKIFIPFFSTKKNGSGIGLSLCKQIMLLHKGNIKVQSEENGGTVFSLQF
ncbi:MAG: sensor histidine kinase [Bacteroidia bacterium]